MPTMTGFPFLSCLIGLPLVFAVVLFGLREPRHIRIFSLSAAAIELALTVWIVAISDFDGSHFLWQERYRWIPSLQVDYLVGIDGISALFLPFTALLTAASILASWNTVKQFHALYYALLLVLESFTLGIFCALDLALFFLFWELTLVPVFFLISLWGIGPHRRHAAVRYTLMMLGSGILLLIGFCLLALNHAHESVFLGAQGFSFDFLELLETPMSLDFQLTIFLLLFIGFAVKAPLFPFHVWLPTAAMEGPIALTALLSGLKLGVYGILRFAMPLAPQATHRLAGFVAAMGIVSALYGGLLALRQTNLRKMLAYSSLSHVGLVVIGLSALNIQGLQGAIFQLLNFAVVAGGTFLLCGFLHRRTGSTDLTALGGLAGQLPWLTTFVFILGLASMGIPGTNGFVAENLILLGAFESHPGLGLGALLSTVIGAAYFIAYFQRAFWGLPAQAARPLADLVPRELWVAVTMTAIVIFEGCYPQSVMGISEAQLKTWLQHINEIDPMTMAGRLPSGHSTKGNVTPPRLSITATTRITQASQ